MPYDLTNLPNVANYLAQQGQAGNYVPTNGSLGKPSMGWDGWNGYNPANTYATPTTQPGGASYNSGGTNNAGGGVTGGGGSGTMPYSPMSVTTGTPMGGAVTGGQPRTPFTAPNGNQHTMSGFNGQAAHPPFQMPTNLPTNTPYTLPQITGAIQQFKQSRLDHTQSSFNNNMARMQQQYQDKLAKPNGAQFAPQIQAQMNAMQQKGYADPNSHQFNKYDDPQWQFQQYLNSNNLTYDGSNFGQMTTPFDGKTPAWMQYLQSQGG